MFILSFYIQVFLFFNSVQIFISDLLVSVFAMSFNGLTVILQVAFPFFLLAPLRALVYEMATSFFYIYVRAASFFFIYVMANSFFYIYAMATSFFYIYVMATSFFYIYAMATSFFYIYVMATSFFYFYVMDISSFYIYVMATSFFYIYKSTERPVVLLNAIFSLTFTNLDYTF